MYLVFTRLPLRWEFRRRLRSLPSCQVVLVWRLLRLELLCVDFRPRLLEQMRVAPAPG